MHPGTDEVVLSGNPEPPVGGAQRQKDGEGAVLASIARTHTPVLAVHDQAVDRLSGQDFDAEPLGLLTQPVGEVRAGDALGEAGEVVEPFGHPGLTADAGPFDHEGAHPFACCVEGSGQSGWTRADDDQVVEGVLRLGAQTQLGGELGVAGLDEGRAVVEQQDGDDALAGIDLVHVGEGRVVSIDVDERVLHPLLAEELLHPLAVPAPAGSVQHKVSHADDASGVRRWPAMDPYESVTFAGSPG